MKQVTYVLLAGLLFLSCSSRYNDKDSKMIYIEEFNWSFILPEFLQNENKDEWENLHKRGMKAIEETYNTDVKDKARNLFMFKSTNESYFYATSEKYDKSKRGDYIENCKFNDDVVYQTLRTQLPNTYLIDTFKRVEMIDEIEFQTLKVKILLPDSTTKNTIIYRQLFNGNELTIGVMFSDEHSGDLIAKAIMQSKFR